MSLARLVIVVILAVALAAGVALYYLQVYAFYEEIGPGGPRDVVLTPADGGAPEPIPHADFRAIDSESSPIRYRACFTTPLALPALDAYAPYPAAEPLNAPGWFDCFDADAVGEALEDGRAVARLSIRDVTYGIDRVAAILPDGRGVIWHQINECGEVVFDGQPAPEGCPPPPEGVARQ